jgi:hypothetical protein
MVLNPSGWLSRLQTSSPALAFVEDLFEHSFTLRGSPLLFVMILKGLGKDITCALCTNIAFFEHLFVRF